ncbi:NAD(P)/FAD-dependent oxidoreductase [Nocardia jinanensis]|uniref:Ferredoxin reductase n=1 Tax=Nocardia jinanensis TaxID=382504 RepID=A0A917RWV9_9NOCA|nr:FAD-dependent oxidoreductase [Nocardia jinanensis]GGL41827.1 ferredoxin reductase [Nocardia jinanensis]
MSETFVVIGGGVGGGTAALALRSEGFTGRIVVLCAEPRPPYSKPPLSKGVLRGEEDADRTALRPPAWYAKKDIEIRTAVSATDLDTERKIVRLSTGEDLAYDKVLIATGGRPRTLPGADGVPGVFTLRTVEDSVAIARQLGPGIRLVVVGGGFIGGEVAAGARTLGCEVTVLEGQSSPLERLLPPTLAGLYMRLHTEHGVTFHTGVAVSDIDDGPRGLVAHAADGATYPADLIVVGIGMVPCDELALRAGLRVDNGVVVDEQCRTSAPDVFAIGDVANAPQPYLGRRMRIEHWQNAQHQAKVAARNMAGGSAEFAEVPWVWSDQYDTTIQITGKPEPTDEVHLRGDVDGWNFSAVLTRAGELAGCVAFNRADDVRAARRIMTDRLPVSLEHLTDPHHDLGELAEAAAAAAPKEYA